MKAFLSVEQIEADGRLGRLHAAGRHHLHRLADLPHTHDQKDQISKGHFLFVVGAKARAHLDGLLGRPHLGRV